MKLWIAFWNILLKDMRTYYLKPPNISWGLIFPLAWTGMFFIKSGSALGSIQTLLPGVVAISILFGTTSMLAVTVTFEKKNRSFERLLLAPIPLELLMLAKTSGAILFGVANAFVPVVMAVFLIDLSQVAWRAFIPAVFLIAVASTFLGLFIAVAVSEVFEAQTFSNREAACFSEANLLCPSPDLWGRRIAWGCSRRTCHAIFPRPGPARVILRRLICGKSP
jgi:ABC-2 type transport system permease protein